MNTEVVTQRCSVEKSVLKNFTKLTMKHLCHNLQLSTLLKKRLWHRCFPVNFAKFLRTPFLLNTSSGWFWRTADSPREENYKSYSPFRHVTNHAFLTWMLFTPLWRSIIKKTNKQKRNKNLKMPSFWQYLTVQIVLTVRKTSLITIFPQLLKIIENAWNFRKWDWKSG